jgi:hypothetical protein
MQGGAGFRIEIAQKRFQQLNTRLSQRARGIEVKLSRESFQRCSEGSRRRREIGEPAITANLGNRAHDANGSELFEDISVTEDFTLNGRGNSGWLMCANGFHDRGNLRGWKLNVTQYLRRLGDCIGGVVPGCERLRVFRAMTNEHADVVQPGCGKHDIVIVDVVLSYFQCQGVQPRLMTELLYGTSLPPNVVFNAIAEVTHALQVNRRRTPRRYRLYRLDDFCSWSRPK